MMKNQFIYEMGKKVVADDPIMVAEHHCTNSALVCFPSKKTKQNGALVCTMDEKHGK